MFQCLNKNYNIDDDNFYFKVQIMHRYWHIVIDIKLIAICYNSFFHNYMSTLVITVGQWQKAGGIASFCFYTNI